jgi:hypothetical protein
VQEDQFRWDYRHQVLEQEHLTPWQLFAAVKWLELSFHLRPRRLWRVLFGRNRQWRREGWWTATHTTLVWLMEIVEFARRVRFARNPKLLGDRSSLVAGGQVFHRREHERRAIGLAGNVQRLK